MTPTDPTTWQSQLHDFTATLGSFAEWLPVLALLLAVLTVIKCAARGR